MNIDDMKAAVDEAAATLSRADDRATQMARILVGRLRKVESEWTLKALKTELRKYNAHTGRWNE